MNLIKWIGAMLILGSIFFGIIALAAEENTNCSCGTTFPIGNILDPAKWTIHKNNSDIDLSTTASGLNISYNLMKKYSYVYIEKEFPFSMLPEKMNKIKFHYTGHGAPNTFEFNLIYKDYSVFQYKSTNATINNNQEIELDPSQIGYLKDGPSGRPTGEPVDFSKVNTVSFAISNWPDMKEPPGRGFMVISGIKGVKAQSWMEWPIIIAAVPSAITGIFSVISVLIGAFFGYYIGRSKSKS